MSPKSFSLAELAALVAAQLIGDPHYTINGVNTLEEATPSDVSFLANPRYTEAMKQSRAGLICITPSSSLPSGKNYLLSSDPSRTFQQIAELLLSGNGRTGFLGIHPTAVIHPTAEIGENVTIGPNAVVDRNSKIGPNSAIGPNVSIGYEVEIGADCILHPNSVVRERCRLGNRVILQPGAVIGSCGFGYTPDGQGRHTKLEQLGIVILEDDVEIGSNTTIDRSRFKATIVRKGSKIDNLVQIAHNVEIGEHNVIAALTGVAGSSKTGRYVMLGGQVGVIGHVELEDHVLVATRGGVSKSLKTGKYRGSPAIPIAEFHRQEVHVRRLEEYAKRIKELEKKLEALLVKM
jgi:UDP-3-O-[3-hydroxymyristoyl] glucosamine N-acyltransferase